MALPFLQLLVLEFILTACHKAFLIFNETYLITMLFLTLWEKAFIYVILLTMILLKMKWLLLFYLCILYLNSVLLILIKKSTYWSVVWTFYHFSRLTIQFLIPFFQALRVLQCLFWIRLPKLFQVSFNVPLPQVEGGTAAASSAARNDSTDILVSSSSAISASSLCPSIVSVSSASAAAACNSGGCRYAAVSSRVDGSSAADCLILATPPPIPPPHSLPKEEQPDDVCFAPREDRSTPTHDLLDSDISSTGDPEDVDSDGSLRSKMSGLLEGIGGGLSSGFSGVMMKQTNIRESLSPTLRRRVATMSAKSAQEGMKEYKFQSLRHLGKLSQKFSHRPDNRSSLSVCEENGKESVFLKTAVPAKANKVTASCNLSFTSKSPLKPVTSSKYSNSDSYRSGSLPNLDSDAFIAAKELPSTAAAALRMGPPSACRPAHHLPELAQKTDSLLSASVPNGNCVGACQGFQPTFLTRDNISTF